MSQYSVLYDALGPRARRRVLYVTLVVAALCVAAVVFALIALDEQGQLAADKWSALFNPTDTQFPVVWTFLLGGLLQTLQAAFLSIVLSLVFGTLIALTRVTANKYYRWFVVGAIETLRGIPVVLTIFFASRVLPTYGIELDLIWYIVIGLTVYNSVAIAEAIRSGIAALPRGQLEAAQAIGFSRGMSLRLVILPQAFRMMMPVIIGQLVVVVKDTSLGFIIGFEELLRRGQIAVQSLNNPLQMYLVIAVLFIVINYALSKLAERVEDRMSTRTAKAKTPGKAPARV